MSVNTFTLRSEQCFAAAHRQTPRTSILGFWTVFFPECLSRRCWTVHLRLQCSLLRWPLHWDQVCALLAAVIPAAMGSALRPGVSNLTRLNNTSIFSLSLPSLAAGFLSTPKEWWQSLIWTRPQSDAVRLRTWTRVKPKQSGRVGADYLVNSKATQCVNLKTCN